MGCVYLLKIETESGEYFKIGCTERDVEQRVAELSTGNPFKINIEHVFETEIYRDLEATMHRVYRVQRIKNEWFRGIELNEFKLNCEIYDRGIKISSKMKKNSGSIFDLMY